MLLGSLALTFITSVSSGCANTANALAREALIQSAAETMEAAGERYDFSDYDLDQGEFESLCKQCLYAYAEEDGTLAKSQLYTVRKIIEKDPNFVYFDLETAFIRDEASADVAFTDTVIGSMGSINADLSFREEVVAGSIVENNFLDISFDYGDTSSGTTEAEGEWETLPMLSYAEESASVSINGTLDGCTFLGIVCSRDACVAVHNALASFLNTQAIYIASGISPLAIVIEAYRSLSLLGTAGIAVKSAIEAAIAKITSAIGSLWSSICAFFGSLGGGITIIVAAIAAFIGAAIIGTLVTMAIYGYMGKGFASGFIIRKWYQWEWYHGEID